jgi:hypothetical protein
MSVNEILSRLGGVWEKRPDGFWTTLEPARLRPAALDLKQAGARFGALTVRPRDGGMHLAWHFDLGGTLLTLQAPLDAGAAAPSLLDLWPGADWAEREARDYYAVEFSGRASTPPLMLRDGDAPGVFLAKPDGERA